ncbi:MAG: hypothetical protein JSS22_02860 [Proteobacteria bacterium]|nr:hypothetical protein [Pseudomonadota bacterium]
MSKPTKAQLAFAATMSCRQWAALNVLHPKLTLSLSDRLDPELWALKANGLAKVATAGDAHAWDVTRQGEALLSMRRRGAI